MSLLRWQPWREVDTLRQQMDRLCEESDFAIKPSS
jgi:hypothetical protein